VRHAEDPHEPLAQAVRPRAAQAAPFERLFYLRRHGPSGMGNRMSFLGKLSLKVTHL
jgi:hypothetical protein